MGKVSIGLVCAFMSVFGVVTGCTATRTNATFETPAPPFRANVREMKQVVSKRIGVMPVRIGQTMTRIDNLKLLVAQLDRWFGTRDWIQPLVPSALPPEQGPGIAVAGAHDEGHVQQARDKPVVFRYWGGTETWRKGLSEYAAEHEVDYVLFVQVSSAPYFSTARPGGGRVLHIGTGYSEPVVTKAASELPVDVLEIAAVLVDARGDLVAVGIEGVLPATRTFAEGAAPSSLHFAADVAGKIAAARRTDLPTGPLAWEAAAQNLCAHLLGKGELLLLRARDAYSIER